MAYRKLHYDDFDRRCVDCRTLDDLFRSSDGDGQWRCAMCLCLVGIREAEAEKKITPPA